MTYYWYPSTWPNEVIDQFNETGENPMSCIPRGRTMTSITWNLCTFMNANIEDLLVQDLSRESLNVVVDMISCFNRKVNTTTKAGRVIKDDYLRHLSIEQFIKINGTWTKPPIFMQLASINHFGMGRYAIVDGYHRTCQLLIADRTVLLPSHNVWIGT